MTRATNKKAAARRAPQQRRSQQTVEAILDAVVKILKRNGVSAVTTNRIAEVAGVSIGSLYQYFPHKRAIFIALHDRHVEQIGRVIERALIEYAESSWEELIRALIEALVDAHTSDPELYELLDNEIPHRAGGVRHLDGHLRKVLRIALLARTSKPERPRDLDKTLFVLTHMIDALAHGVVLRRPPQLTVTAAKQEAVHAVLAYLRGS